MISRQALVAVLATVALQYTDAFVAPSPRESSLRTKSLCSGAAKSEEEDLELTRMAILDHIGAQEVNDASVVEETKPIMDIPPAPVAPADPMAASKSKPAAVKKLARKKGGHGK